MEHGTYGSVLEIMTEQLHDDPAEKKSVVVREEIVAREGDTAPSLKLCIRTNKNKTNPLTILSKYLWDQPSPLSPKPLTKKFKHIEQIPDIVVQDVTGDAVEGTSEPSFKADALPSFATKETDDTMGIVDRAKPTPTGCITAQTLNIDLSSETTTCLASTKKGRRCTNLIAKRNSEEARLILRRVEKTQAEELGEDVTQSLDTLAELLLCKRYHQGEASTLSTKWTTGIKPNAHTRRASDSVLVSPETLTNRPIVATSRRSSAVTRSVAAAAQAPSPIVLRSTEVKTDFLGGKSLQTCIRTFVPFDPLAKSRAHTERYVRGAIMKDLISREETEGFIYIYWFPGNFGHLKIGVTTRSPEERLREWQKQCGHDPILIYPAAEEDRVMIPHVYRVEKLVHAQLRDVRRKETRCEKCEKCHREWFEGPAKVAIATVKRWSAWISDEPYKLQGGVWRLSPIHKKNLNTLCQRVVEDNDTQPTTTKLRDRNRRLSAAPLRRHRAKSEGPLRRSSRIAERQRSTSLDKDNTSDTEASQSKVKEEKV